MSEAKAEVDPEREWREKVYRPGVPQLTARAVVAGMLIGGIMCLSNLYVVLKTGWSLGVTVTSVVLAFALFSLVEKVGLTKNHFSILENNAMGSVASAAGYMTGGGNMAAIPALFLLTGSRPSGMWLFLWFAVIAALGVFAAIPIKRQLINIEKIPFPSGIATAETLVSLHGDADGKGAGEGTKKAKWLAIASVVGGVVALMRGFKTSWVPWNLPGKLELPFGWRGHKAMDWSMGIDASMVYIGAGAIIGIRVCGWMFVGAVVCHGFIAPAMLEIGAIKGVGYQAILQFTVWPAAAMLIASGLMAFAFQWRSIANSFRGLSGAFLKKTGIADPSAEIECPGWWFPAGFLVLGPIVVFLMSYLFGIPWWAGLIALPLSMLMGVVAARVTGETDITPTKALGPATQIVYGAMVPGNLPANIMGANVTGGIGLHAADLLTDLKSGYLVGANPRQQFFAQFFGVIAGAAVVVPVFSLLVPTADVLGSEEFPAPAVQVWAGVSRALVEGLGAIPSQARVAAAIGAAVGVLLTLAERFVPKRFLPFVPSPSGVGIAFMVPGSQAVTMFLGAALGEGLKRFRPNMPTSVASGLIAGESLVGVAVLLLVATGVLKK